MDAKNHNFDHIFEDKRRIFNLDETALCFAPDKNKVLAEKNSKHVYNSILTGEKENLTVLLTINAAGELAPPLVIFPLKKISKDIAKNANRDWALAVSEKGWITSEIFFEYVANTFLKWLKDNNFEFPIILFYDGHSSHLKYWLAKFCKENEIIVIVLYPNSTHVTQPLDVGIFKPVKRAWEKKVLALKQQGIKLTNKNFCGYFEEVLDFVLGPTLDEKNEKKYPTIAENAFRKAGLQPFDPNAVNYEKLTKKKNKNSLNENSNAATPVPEANSNASALLDEIETQLDAKTLNQFYTNVGGKWQGEVQYEKLFEFWRKLKMPVNLNSDINSSMDTELSNMNDT